MASGYTVPIGKSGYILNGDGLDKYDELIKAYISNKSTNVVVTPILSTGTQIATIKVDNTTKTLYAPSGGGGSEGHIYNSEKDSLAEGTKTTVADLNKASGERSHAEGFKTKAYAKGAHAEGKETIAKGWFSHAEGIGSQAIDKASHAEGYNTQASGTASHAEGADTEARGIKSHAEGYRTHAEARHSHAEGYKTYAEGCDSHVEGAKNYAVGAKSHAEGHRTTSIGENSHAEGHFLFTKGENAHAEGSGGYKLEKKVDEHKITIPNFIDFRYASIGTNEITLVDSGDFDYFSTYDLFMYKDGKDRFIRMVVGKEAPNKIYLDQGFDKTIQSGVLSFVQGVAYGNQSHTEGKQTNAIGLDSHAEGKKTVTLGTASHAEGKYTLALGRYSHAEGEDTEANEFAAHAEGIKSCANYKASHAEGHRTIADGKYSHTEGEFSAAYEVAAHAEGRSTKAFGKCSHAEGHGTYTDSGADGSHAEGFKTRANGHYSHAEGIRTCTGSSAEGAHAEGEESGAYGWASHASGKYTRAWGCGSTATGIGTIASLGGALACGHYNEEENALFIVGCGSDKNNRATAFKVYNSSHGGSATLTGHMHADKFSESSDIRLKNVLGDISLEKAYDLVDKCQTILYTLKDDKTQSHRIGLIAQEVKEYFPEVITVDEKGYYGIDYSNLTVVILKVLKDIIQRISKLENKETN